LSSMTETPKRRGKQKAPTLVHVNMRLPQYVVDHFKSGPNYTREMRRVLTEYVERTAAVRCEEREK
jgi:uncharacterized protein (DUF4415 family)